MSKVIQPKYRLLNIKTEEFACHGLDGEIEKEKLQIQFLHQYNINSDEKIVSLYVGCRIVNKAQANFIKVVARLDFQLINFEQILGVVDSEIKIPRNLAETLFSIGIGTLRGILHAKTEGQFLNKLFIPVVDVKKLLKEINVKPL